jgi:hypothetical protein
MREINLHLPDVDDPGWCDQSTEDAFSSMTHDRVDLYLILYMYVFCDYDHV